MHMRATANSTRGAKLSTCRQVVSNAATTKRKNIGKDSSFPSMYLREWGHSPSIAGYLFFNKKPFAPSTKIVPVCVYPEVLKVLYRSIGYPETRSGADPCVAKSLHVAVRLHHAAEMDFDLGLDRDPWKSKVS